MKGPIFQENIAGIILSVMVLYEWKRSTDVNEMHTQNLVVDETRACSGEYTNGDCSAALTVADAAMERRIIIIGKKGNGRSSTGNTCLGKDAFKADSSLITMSQTCNSPSSYNFKNTYTMLETPGLLDTDVSLGTQLLEIQRSVEICPQPHAFLLVFSSETGITKDEEEYTIDLLRVAFGEKVFGHCIVVFTHGNKFDSDQEFEKFWKQSGMIVKLVKSCGGRIVRIENSDQINPINVFIDLIEAMSDEGNKTYQYPWIKEHKRVLQVNIDKYNGIGDLRHQLSVLAHALGKVLASEVWRVMLFGGTIISPSASGVSAGGYIGYMAAGMHLPELSDQL